MAQAPAIQPPQPAAMPRVAEAPCQTSGALGVARVVEIDTNGGPGFGFQHFKAYDFLNPGEVVLTFDDGPWPGNTPAVLAALAAQCTKATFFSIGKHATWHPEILKQVAAAGHTVGSHTWSHADLSKKTPDEGKEEIEKGLSAVRAALGGPVAPFFRFPTLRQPPEMVTYLEGRNIAMFSTDVDCSTSRSTKRTTHHLGDEQAQEAGQGHHPDARLPARHRAGDAAAARRAQGGRLQGRAPAAQVGRRDPARSTTP